jgi:hypothetical protein
MSTACVKGPLLVFGPPADDAKTDHAKMRTTPAYFRADDGTSYVYVAGSTKSKRFAKDGVPPSVVRLRVVIESGKPAHLVRDAADTELSFVNPGIAGRRERQRSFAGRLGRRPEQASGGPLYMSQTATFATNGGETYLAGTNGESMVLLRYSAKASATSASATTARCEGADRHPHQWLRGEHEEAPRTRGARRPRREDALSPSTMVKRWKPAAEV